MKKMILCENCIEAIRSRGEKLFVGDPVEKTEETICEWCDDDDEDTELFEVIFR